MITRRKQDFIDYYIKNKNATQSAKEAGYSIRTAYSQGHRLLRNVEISTAIDKGIEELKAKYNISREDYITQTIKNWEVAKHPSTKERYWELLGKIYGYTKETIELQTDFKPPPVFYNKIEVKTEERIKHEI